MNKEQIKIKDEFIKLSALLKFSAIVGTGGEAKDAILKGNVFLNNEVCTIKGKKIFKGDIIKFLDNIIEVI